jgi:hypothetical protein
MQLSATGQRDNMPCVANMCEPLTVAHTVRGRVLIHLVDGACCEANGVVDGPSPDLVHLDESRVNWQPRCISTGPAQGPLGQQGVAQVEGSAISAIPGGFNQASSHRACNDKTRAKQQMRQCYQNGRNQSHGR